MQHGILNKAKHVLAAGRSGTGKTQLGLNYIQASDHDRVGIFDHEGEFAFRLGLPLAETLEEFWDRMQRERVVCFDFSENYGGERELVFDELCAQCLEVCKTVFEPRAMRTLFVVDEVQKFASPHFLPLNFSAMLDTGRRRLLDTLSLSQLPQAMHPALRVQFTEIFLFCLDEPTAREFVDKIGFDSDLVAALPDKHFIYRNRQNGRTAEGEVWFPRLTVPAPAD